ncbi:MAG TPA: response regulator transcription factor [Sedimentisphaerales bacterium]|nr:response regulator transcription factor [Sedimentisphaerales bacterium]HOV77381.1 response regulator transcription factor [Sedimentisphaerales bacterium]HQI28283.1 response regulator transcription factor [Sedimentisphaerales bacterium]
MSKASILVVDDEDDIRELVQWNLDREGYRVLTCETGEQALAVARSKIPDLIILDLMLPGIDGLEVCKRLKADSGLSQIPVVMLTAKGEESDIVAGLELGADDYITKPFSGKVLVARVRRLLRKATETGDEKGVVKIHGLVIDPGRHEVTLAGKPIVLTLTEFNILHTLARRSGQVFTRYQIVDSIHGDDYLVTDRAVDVQIVALRRKLGAAGKLIETVRGVGYRFKD